MYQLTHPDLDVLQKRMVDWNHLGQQFPIFENKESAEKIFAALILADCVKRHRRILTSADVDATTKAYSLDVTSDTLRLFVELPASELLALYNYSVRKEE